MSGIAFPEESIEAMRSGTKQLAEAATYFGTACNSLQAQLYVLLSERARLGQAYLIEVSPATMDTMRLFPVIGKPIFFAIYPDGVTKGYPIPNA